MEPSTHDYLRKAATEALASKDDAAALQLIGLLCGGKQVNKPQQTELAIASTGKPIEGTAHSSYFWAQVIRESFLPKIKADGRNEFTSNEVFTWLESKWNGNFNSEDLAKHDDTITWRARASYSFTILKREKLIWSELHKRTYRFTP